MGADILHFPTPAPGGPPVVVVLSYVGQRDNGLPYYAVDFVESDGARMDAWDGTDLQAARDVASECAMGAGPNGSDLKIIDRTIGVAS